MTGDTSARPTGLNVRSLAARLRSAVARTLFEQRLELDSSEFVGAADLGLQNDEYQFYVPSQWLTLRTALWARNPSPEDVFIDIGSGKGRVVIQAARYPFRRVIGLELSPALTEVARRNLERNRERLTCQRVELVTADLVDYEFPQDITIAYCYHSVAGRTFQVLMERLESVAQRRGAPILFIYSNPLEHEAVLATGRARMVRRYPPRLHLRHALHLYEISPW